MSLIKSIYRKFVISDIKNTEAVPDVAEWHRFLQDLPQPKDRIEEAFLKYKCRLWLFPGFKVFLLNCASVFVLIKMLLSSSGDRVFPEIKESRLILEKKKDVDPSDVFPAYIKNEYDSFDIIPEGTCDSHNLTKEGKTLFYKTMRRYPFRPYFLLWILRELSKHCSFITKYNPSTVAVYIEERNVAGPILTEMYERSGRSLVSFMHGEYIFQIIQAYMDFSKYYIWDTSYQTMFQDALNCHIGEYCVYTPKKLEKKWALEKTEPTVFCTYYFSGESKRSIACIADIFKRFESLGYSCQVRPHPRYSHIELIQQSFPEEMIEDPHSVSMEASLGRTKNVIGLSTTVHSEAFVEGRTAVVDDVSEPEMYNNLKERYYIALNRPHRLLSDLMDEVFSAKTAD